MFGRLKQLKSTIISLGEDAVIAELDPNAPAIVDAVSGATVDARCNATITITCLQQLYNAVGVVPSASNNSFAVTGYLVIIYLVSVSFLADLVQGQNANLNDLQLFYADQRPDAKGSSFTFVSVNGNFTKKTKTFNYQSILYSFLFKAGSTTKHHRPPVMKPILTRSLVLASLIRFQ